MQSLPPPDSAPRAHEVISGHLLSSSDATTPPRCRVAPDLPPSRGRPLATNPPRCRVAPDFPPSPSSPPVASPLSRHANGDKPAAMPRRTRLPAIAVVATGRVAALAPCEWRQTRRDAASHPTSRHRRRRRRSRRRSRAMRMATSPPRCRIAPDFPPSPSSPPVAPPLSRHANGDKPLAMPHRTRLVAIAGSPRAHRPRAPRPLLTDRSAAARSRPAVRAPASRRTSRPSWSARRGAPGSRAAAARWSGPCAAPRPCCARSPSP